MKILNREERRIYLVKMLIEKAPEDVKKETHIYLKKLEPIIDALEDESILVVPPLTVRETYIIRKRLGILNHGEQQTLKTIHEESSVSKQRIQQIIDEVIKKIIIYLQNEKDFFKESEVEKMTSMDADFDKGNLRNEYIGNLGVGKYVETILNRNGINTISQLLSYSLEELREICNLKELAARQLIIKIHGLGLSFIDELTAEEKRAIIKISRKNKIQNSTIDWIPLDRKKRKTYIKTYGIRTIENLLHAISSRLINDEETYQYLQTIGIIPTDKIILLDEEGRLSNTDDFRMTLDQLLDIKIEDIAFSTKIYYTLKNYGIKTIKDIVSLSFQKLTNIKNLEIKDYFLIINLIHDLGLFFIDEVQTTKSYLERIQAKLNDSSRELEIDAIAKKQQQLYARYEALLEEKQDLQLKTIKLDKEIDKVLSQIRTLAKGESYGKTKK